MPIKYTNDADPDRVYFPKVGAEGTFHIKEFQQIEEDGHPDNFKSTSKNYGFRYKVHMQDGKYALLNTFKLYYEFKAQNINDGDSIVIEHPSRGFYKVRRLVGPGKDAADKMVQETAAMFDGKVYPTKKLDKKDSISQMLEGWTE
jgi:hypothetical protein